MWGCALVTRNFVGVPALARSFRFACQAYAPSSRTDWLDTARRAEDLGYSTLHLADHYFGPGPALEEARHPLQTVAAIPAMMSAAGVTESLRIGCRVLCVDYHHPVVLAKELATIDLLSDGRLEPGFGAGWVTSEYEALGIPMEPPGVRIERLIETVELVRAFFLGAELSFHGSHVTARNMCAVPASVQPEGPRIMVGGGSPRVLRAAGRLADIVSLNFDNSSGQIGSDGVRSGASDQTMRKIAWVREGAQDRFENLEIEIGAYFTSVTEQAQSSTEQVAQRLGVTSDELRDHPHVLIGSVAEIVEALEAQREIYGISYVTVGASVLEEFAPVVARLAGQ